MASYDARPRATRSLEYPPLRPALATTTSRKAARKAAAVPAGPTPSVHEATVRRLKGVAIMATAVTIGMFGSLVVAHPVGSASQTVRPVTAGGVVSEGSSQTVTSVDPFFDPNPGSGGGQDLAPVFGSGGGSPAFQSSGS